MGRVLNSSCYIKCYFLKILKLDTRIFLVHRKNPMLLGALCSYDQSDQNIMNQMLSDFYCISLYKNTPNLPLLIPSGFSRGFQDTYGHLGRAIPV